ncbi:MAG: hypothetical protein KKI02_02225 [Planctomycetes bacterium]|nr:hypothetical protein [Planctomycetota bacterium]
MGLIAGYIVRLALGVAFLAPWFMFTRHTWSEWFGLEGKSTARFIGFDAWGFFPWVLLGGGAVVGGTLIAWVGCDILTRIDPRLAVTLGLDIRFYLAGGFGLSHLVIPLSVYCWKCHQFRRLMETGSPRCEKCDYALRGLGIKHGRIRCPECGHKNAARDVVRQFRHDKRILKHARKKLWEMHKS